VVWWVTGEVQEVDDKGRVRVKYLYPIVDGKGGSDIEKRVFGNCQWEVLAISSSLESDSVETTVGLHPWLLVGKEYVPEVKTPCPTVCAGAEATQLSIAEKLERDAITSHWNQHGKYKHIADTNELEAKLLAKASWRVPSSAF
jgi:hypothetical protein